MPSDRKSGEMWLKRVIQPKDWLAATSREGLEGAGTWTRENKRPHLSMADAVMGKTETKLEQKKCQCNELGGREPGSGNMTLLRGGGGISCRGRGGF